MIIAILSRYVVGWMVAGRESERLAEVLIRQTCTKQAMSRASPRHGSCASGRPWASAEALRAVRSVLDTIDSPVTSHRARVSCDRPAIAAVAWPAR